MKTNIDENSLPSEMKQVLQGGVYLNLYRISQGLVVCSGVVAFICMLWLPHKGIMIYNNIWGWVAVFLLVIAMRMTENIDFRRKIDVVDTHGFFLEIKKYMDKHHLNEIKYTNGQMKEILSNEEKNRISNRLAKISPMEMSFMKYFHVSPMTGITIALFFNYLILNDNTLRKLDNLVFYYAFLTINIMMLVYDVVRLMVSLLSNREISEK